MKIAYQGIAWSYSESCAKKKYPNSEKFASKCLSLPIDPYLNKKSSFRSKNTSKYRNYTSWK